MGARYVASDENGGQTARVGKISFKITDQFAFSNIDTPALGMHALSCYTRGVEIVSVLLFCFLHFIKMIGEARSALEEVIVGLN
jgi:hypothetical protein